ncbi:hypothetical protein KLK06_11980 [Nonomuraea sp. NEAU-A123]|nr:hypothetical protein [Nonomuraea sp. NEAU-A123]
MLAEDGSDSTRPSHPEIHGSIGIRLLEASSNRRDDPRALLYIVDHMNPDNRISRRLEVKNSSATAQHVTVYAGAAEIVHNEFVPVADRHANELSSWVSIDPAEFIVPPNGRAPLKATINIPKSASKGERYGAIWAEVESSSPSKANENVKMVNRVGIRIYLDVGPGGDPPSEFSIEQLTPGRTEDGMPVVKATIHNTGERALDMSGKLWLSEGPGGLKAGPFPAQTGTTLAPGDSAPVMVMLDHRLPDGPWKVRLLMESGRVHHEATGTLTFPAKNAAWGLPALLDSFLPQPLILIGAIAAGTLLLVLTIYLRRRNRRRVAC